MNGKEFIRAVRKLAKKTGETVIENRNRGKGGHIELRYGQARTIVKTGEIGIGLFNSMCRQLGINPRDLR